MSNRIRKTAAAAALLALATLAACASAQNEAGIYPDLKVGAEGEFKKGKDDHHKATVVKVIGINAAIVRIDRNKDFVVSEIKTKDVADGDELELTGRYKVKGTLPYKGRTYKLVEKQKG